jgi:hypothetical protein
MTETVRDQILAIRDTGLTNMFDLNMVQRLAYEREFYDLGALYRGAPEGQVRPFHPDG